MDATPTPPCDNMIFALDIGTRNIIGLAGTRRDDVFHVAALEVAAHPRRAMVDGQIEDIAQVARVAAGVKQRVEQTLGRTLRRVNVAAAGRALKTTRASHQTGLPPGPVTPRTVYELENTAINLARQQLEEGPDSEPYYCVGHSVVRSLLDGYPFSTLVGHRGGTAEIEVIATFLPAEVVNSLRSCMDLLEADIETLTLEPIAAMRAVIPPELRLLNLALCDIGAGTSDIAISADGTVLGYTMATVAGDEITEAIIKQYLVDFTTAETIKMALSGGGPVAFTDILGTAHSLAPEEILARIEPAVDMLAQVVCERIEAANGGPPAAVFLVGGGARTPGLARFIADRLGLEPAKVALAGNNFSGRLASEGSGLDGPEFATPLGIALTAADNADAEGDAVLINGAAVRLFSAGPTSVMDALLLGGYRYADLMGRNGKSLTFNLNGKRTVVRGEFLTPAEIAVNGNPAILTSPVENGDVITLVPAVSGRDAQAFATDFTKGTAPFEVTLDGTPCPAGVLVEVNGTPVEPDTLLHDFDNLNIIFLKTIAELCEYLALDADTLTFSVNGKPQDAGHTLQPGDTIETLPRLAHHAAAPDEAPHNAAGPAVPPPESKEPAARLHKAAGPAAHPSKTGAAGKAQNPANEPARPVETGGGTPPETPQGPEYPPVPPAEKGGGDAHKPPALAAGRSLPVVLNGRSVVLPPLPGGQPYTVAALLELVDIDPGTPGEALNLRVNDENAGFTTVVQNDDRVDIHPIAPLD